MLAEKINAIAPLGCDDNYADACVPDNVLAVHCAGDGGVGPDVQGPFRVVGWDHFGLDRDADKIACEVSRSDRSTRGGGRGSRRVRARPTRRGRSSMLDRVNGERANAGLPPLRSCPLLDRSAQDPLRRPGGAQHHDPHGERRVDPEQPRRGRRVRRPGGGEHRSGLPRRAERDGGVDGLGRTIGRTSSGTTPTSASAAPPARRASSTGPRTSGSAGSADPGRASRSDRPSARRRPGVHPLRRPPGAGLAFRPGTRVEVDGDGRWNATAGGRAWRCVDSQRSGWLVRFRPRAPHRPGRRSG